MKTKPKAMPTKRKAAATPSKGRGRKATMSPSADVTMLDKCGRVTFERLRREHADPADRFMDASGKPFTKAVAMPDGRTVYRRPDNVWDAVRDWIDEQISWAHTNIVDGMRLWREVEHAHIVAMREPHTSTNVEILIAECVKAFTATHAAADVKATDVDAGRDTPDDSNAGRADVEYVKVRPFTAAERAEMQKHIADIQAGNYVADLADYQIEWIADAFQSELEAVDAAALIVWKILLTADEREAAMGIGVVGCYTRANDRDDYFHEAEQRARDFAGQCSDQQKRDAVTRLIESDTGATYSPGCGAFIRADLVDGLGLTECAIAHGWVRVNGGGRDFACVDGKPYVIEKTFDIYECAPANKLRQERDAQSRADADARAQLERDAAAGRNVGATLKSIDERMDALRGDFADVGDTMCEIAGREHAPPTWKEIKDDAWKEKLYTLLKKATKGKKTLRQFLETCEMDYRGFKPRDIFKNVDDLRRFERAAYNKYKYRQ